MSVPDNCQQAQNRKSIAEVREAILVDRKQTIHDVCEVVGLSYGTIQRILADDLNMRCTSARFVPRLLSDDQKALRISVCRELKRQARDDLSFISNIIISDETWVYGYDPETKQQSSQWKSPNSLRQKKACQVCSNVKSTLIFFFFDIQGIVYKEFVPPGQTINGKFYCEVLKWQVGHLAQTSRQVEEKQLVSPPWQCIRSHITRSTVPGFQKHYSYSPPRY